MMKRAVLAAIRIDQSESEFDAALLETESLCEACEINVIAKFTQNSRSMDPNTGFRSGKLKEISAYCAECDPDLIVFHNPISIQISERVSAACGVNVIDRTALILDIFAARARSTQAKLQVEMARLQYDLPRALNSSADEAGHERGGSAYNRGAGEMRSRLVQRKYSERIASLRKDLEKIKKQKYQDERRRTRTMMRRVALVGYTNAGKSSLMNAMIKAGSGMGTEVYEEDMLFATLDTSVRMIPFKGRKFLLYDTVGFVSDLPHTLIDAFQATLDAARDADLLVHVIDSSDPMYERKADITADTLKQIHADEIPLIRVYTKSDLCKNDIVMEQGMLVSAKTGEGIEEFMEHMLNTLYPLEDCVKCLIPYNKMAMADAYRSVLIINTIEHTEEGMICELRGPRRYTAAFRNMKI
ncbi:MAG: GTPase HflX [Solobacterium sp.]|nr:GTPase HflX [Solobacterium sp.]